MPAFKQRPHTPTTEGLGTGRMDWMPPVPLIEDDQPLPEIIHELTQIVRSHFSNVEDDDRGVFETRGYACEIVSWRFLNHLSEHELIDYLLTEVPPTASMSDFSSEIEEGPAERPKPTRTASNIQVHDHVPLLFEDSTASTKLPEILEPPQRKRYQSWNSPMSSESIDDDPTLAFVGLNALEIATVAGAKRFLSQQVVQHVINGIWAGDIIFWESLSIHTKKRAQLYHQQ
ncbi:MAG: hypothetical protein Q9223_005050 [Gallowayella weberi]